MSYSCTCTLYLLKFSCMWYRKRGIRVTAVKATVFAVFTPECRSQLQGSAGGWNTCRLSSSDCRTHFHRRNPHSLILHYSEVTGWYSALQRHAHVNTLYVLHVHTPTDKTPLRENELSEWDVDGSCLCLRRWSSLHSDPAPHTVLWLSDMPAAPTGSPCTLCLQTGRVSPCNGNGTGTELK